jgi:sigma-B regulation protein RsbU (phosphoserine phosphatase)
MLTLVASRVAGAIENARLYTRVAHQARSLTLLNEIARGLTSILNLDELLQRVGDELRRLTDYQMFSVLLLNKSNILEHRFSVRFGEKVQIKQNIPLGEGLVGYAALHNETVSVGDVLHDPRYINTNPETRSELVVPMVHSGRMIGVLDIEHTRLGYFTEEHVRTISTLAAQVAIAIDNARLYETVREQERRMEQELALARELQRRVLPPACPTLRTADIAARFLPARQIGGDLYDFLPQSSERMGIAVGDVSGKGAPAAIYAALTSGYLRSRAGERLTAAQMMAALNTSLTDRPVPGAYVSLLYAVWDEATGRLLIANSGLPQPIVYRAGAAQAGGGECKAVDRIEVSGLPAGLFPEASYEQATLAPEPGDVIVLFTDGIMDASSAAGEMFGRTRMEQVVAAHHGGTAEELVGEIFAAVTAHADGVEQFDDQTVVALKFLGE